MQEQGYGCVRISSKLISTVGYVQGIVAQFLTREKDVSLLQNVQTRCGAHPATYSRDTGGSSTSSKAAKA
jgi:hypothetical protein